MKKLQLLLLFAGMTTAHAQANGGVMLLCRPTQQDSILLRWAPTDKQTWDLGNRYGYVVERYTLLRNGKLLEDRELQRLTPEPQTPAPAAEWEPYEDDKYVSIAAECIFGESPAMPLAGPSAIAQKYKEEQNRFSMALFAADQSVLTARLSGLFAVDKTALADEKYLYKIYIAAPDSLTVDTAFAFTGLSEYQALPQPIDLTARWENKKVQLSWNILYLNHIYNSYVVEKSQDGKQYTPISENATVQAVDEGTTPEYAYRSDSLPDNRSKWYYRVRGINAFGELGPPSDSVVGRGRIPITFAPIISNKEVIDNKRVSLTWEYPDTLNESITGFRLYRSSKPTGTKEKIYESKKPKERVYIDPQPNLTNYYVLSVFDDETEKFSPQTYAELLDSIPPAAPRGLAGVIDSTGIVRLTWDRNKDKDINGYRVYRSSRPDFEFILVTSAMIADTFFTDSINLKTLTKQVYYCLRAEDLRLNQSALSAVLELKRPDIIPPVSPEIQSVAEKKNAFVITWFNSSSDDVVRHHVYRKEATDTTFQLLTSIEKRPKKALEKQSIYQDNSVQAGETYIYQVQAEDDSGLFSKPSSPVQRKAPGEKSDEITLKKQETDGEVTLTWTVKSKKRVERILIYKQFGNEAIRMHDSTTESIFKDMVNASEQTLHYRIKALYDDGRYSVLSNEVKITR
ncbi:fibronectin type III domain-containing protein [Candidatus Symbiothrix dinenymphae]|nr:fibronectin type III domain-containing protein [Candidatus Symbiothrix dinenymphae]